MRDKETRKPINGYQDFTIRIGRKTVGHSEHHYKWMLNLTTDRRRQSDDISETSKTYPISDDHPCLLRNKHIHPLCYELFLPCKLQIPTTLRALPRPARANAALSSSIQEIGPFVMTYRYLRSCVAADSSLTRFTLSAR